MTLQDWEDRYPLVRWREPVQVQTPEGATHYACRVCIANHGLKGTQVPKLPLTEREVHAHIQQVHLRPS